MKIYAFYSDEVLSRCHPHFVQFKNSKKYHARSGACTTAARTDKFGPLLLREAFCACARCFVFDFRNCLVQEHVGRVQTAEVPRKTGAPARTTQTQALSSFAVVLKKDQTWAVRAAEDQVASEGRYWLAQLQDNAYQNPTQFMHAGQSFEEGFFIVKIRWWQCIRRGVIRSYKLSSEDMFISANFIVRTDGPVRMAKPSAAEKRRRLKGEYDLFSEEQTRIFDAT